MDVVNSDGDGGTVIVFKEIRANYAVSRKRRPYSYFVMEGLREIQGIAERLFVNIIP